MIQRVTAIVSALVEIVVQGAVLASAAEVVTTERGGVYSEIEQLDGIVGIVTVDEKVPGRPIIGLDLKDAGVTDNVLLLLKRLPNLKEIELMSNPITDAGLKHLGELHKLESLGLSDTKITDVGLKHLRGLPNLRSLDLSRTQVTDVGLKQIQGMKSLESLDLWGTDVTDSGLGFL